MSEGRNSKPVGIEYGNVRAPLDQAAVDKYFTKHVPSFRGPSKILQFSFGQSNPTYFVTSASGERYVLRKKPPDALMSQTAHAVEREYRVIEAVGKTGKVPVPKVYALCTDSTVLGTPFYVMQYLEGRIFTDVQMPEIKTKAERSACWRDIVRVLAELHKLRPAEIGLGDYGSTAPFYPRQIKSLSKVSKTQGEVKDRQSGEEVGEIPGSEFLTNWYSQNAPKGGRWEGGIIHGDFKCDNMIFHPTEPRVIGVLDWELSTLGHPLSDLANLLQPFYVPSVGDDNDNQNTHIVALRDIDPKDLPIPGADELIRIYCKSVGRSYPLENEENWAACVSFAFFRLAVIAQGIAARLARGQASSAQAKRYSVIFPSIGMLAMDTIMRSEQPKL